MARVVPSERFRRELDDALEGVAEQVDPIEAVGRLGARLILQQALEDEVTEFSAAPATSAAPIRSPTATATRRAR